MRFLRNVLATVVGLLVFFGVLFLILAGIVASASSEEEVVVEENSVLRIELNKPIVERENDDALNDLSIFPGADNGGIIGLVELRKAIQAAKDDDNIKGIYLTTGLAPAGWAAYEEIRNELIDFKTSGKFIIAYSEFLTEPGYYLGAVADELHLFPEGIVEFNGLYQGVTFLKGALDKLGVEPRIFRVGKFKGAVEPFTRTSISDENRLQIESYLNSIYDTYLEGLAATTDLSEPQLRDIADSMRVFLPQQAVDQKLVTQLSYDDQVKESLRRKLGLEPKEEDSSEEDDDAEEDINFISLGEYQQSLADDEEYSRNRVAVIVAEGTIVNGEGSSTSVGGETFAQEIREAREDDNVKAIVLRINSPGGSASASDQMWREVQLTKGVKPIIASMSTYAASGGYYLAMGCDTIVAQPNTITGSIGIFLLSFGAQELLDKIGVTVDVVKTAPLADLLNPSQPLGLQEERILQSFVDNGYETFVSKVAEGRGMTVAAVKELAGGRVYTGKEALDLKLVDMLGGLDTAVALAVRKANLEGDDYRVKYYPEAKPLFQQLLEELDQSASTYFLKRELGPLYPHLQQWHEVEQWQGLQMRLPWVEEVR